VKTGNIAGENLKPRSLIIQENINSKISLNNWPGLLKHVDSAIRRVNHYPDDVGYFVNTYTLDSDLPIQ